MLNQERQLFNRCRDCRNISTFNNSTDRDILEKTILAFRSLLESNKSSIVSSGQENEFSENEARKIFESGSPFPDIVFFHSKCNSCNSSYRVFINWYQSRGQVLKKST